MKSLLLTTFAATLFVSCSSPFAPSVKHKTQTTSNPDSTTTSSTPQRPTLPPAPPSTHVDKEVEDTNYQEQYMYPEDGSTAKKDPVVKDEVIKDTATTESDAMTKSACIAMIGQEKFDKYSEMFGSEEASIKRCGMMKSMQKS